MAVTQGVKMHFQTIPILRIFDEQKAKDFYLGFLGMSLDWEHRFEPSFPIYMQVTRNNLVFHLSEHSGDGTPGTKLFINVDSFADLHQDLLSKKYPYSRPEISTAPWGDRIFEVIDPFGNKILFNECRNT